MKRLLYLLPILLLAACQTAPEEIPDDLSQAELIQLAQESSEMENWAAARAYYQAIIDRFQGDRASVAVARYELGFVEYQRGDFDAARAEFDTLLGMYDFQENQLPAWPRVLGEVIIERMEDEAADADATAEE